ncbi:uncharacterized protein [Triticum aestivum]|uniref:uncharacterized protein n=1 Tax=Triticum aestivum TaxID=4565 RepID=UPI001D010B84|nr:uncharacterized protein LOC123117546 [Triticum aestivum]
MEEHARGDRAPQEGRRIGVKVVSDTTSSGKRGGCSLVKIASSQDVGAGGSSMMEVRDDAMECARGHSRVHSVAAMLRFRRVKRGLAAEILRKELQQMEPRVK